MQAAIAPRTLEPDAGSRKRKVGVLAAVALAQLFAFWLVCSHQVRKAEVRRAEWQVQQMALSDCLEYIAGSTIASCSNDPLLTHARAALPADASAAAGTRPAQAMSGATPVSFSFR